MKIRWVLVFFMMFFTSYICAAESGVITKVEVKGNRNVKTEKILRVTKLKKGKPYSMDAVKKDAGAIRSLDCIDDVKFSYDEGKRVLTFTVVEKRYTIDTVIFKGNSEKFTTGKLRDISLLKKGEHYDNSNFDKTKEKILKHYKDNGYSNCHIQGYPTDNLDTNRVTVTFLITENHQTLIGGVDIKGVNSFEKKKILGLMRKIKEGKVYLEEFLEEDTSKIEEFYKENGFMDYKLVSSPTIYNKEKTKVFLTLDISEGSKYKIGKITYNGDLSVDDEEIKKLIKLKENQFFSDNEIYKTEVDIRDFYANRGYVYARIDHSFNQDVTNNGTIDINFSIQKNHPVYVGSINIDGLEGTERSFVERELLLKQGDLLEANKLIRSIQKLNNLGFLEVVEHRQVPVVAGGKSNTVDLMLDIAELSPANILANIGASITKRRWSFLGGARVEHKNLFGRGQTVGVYTVSDMEQKNKFSCGLDWEEPWVLDKNASLSAGCFYIIGKEDLDDIADAYKEKTFGFKFVVGHRIDENMRFSGGYQFEHVRSFDIKEKARDVTNAYYDTLKPKDTTKISSILGDYVYDSRDYYLDPSTGNYSRLDAQLASSLLIGDVNFLELGGKTTWYFPTFWKFVLSIGVEGRMVMSYGDQRQVPMNKRFCYSEDFVRGYDEKGEIGPKFGGRIKGLMNIEYKFPIFPLQDDKTIIQGIVFSDIGGIWNDWKDINFKIGSENNNLHSSLGFGIRFMTPWGHFRFDNAWGFNHLDSNKGHWSLSISNK
ncbi:outer membrane protein [Endomicrobiia bacterium]|nr:outer membrane protein [Endomicrobiia bacterium]